MTKKPPGAPPGKRGSANKRKALGMVHLSESPPMEAKPRFPKSAIAAITAGGILLGGGVTYSLWSDSAGGAGTTELTTGKLTIETTGTASLQEVVGNALVSIADGHVVVPGETFQLTQGFAVELDGAHMDATLGLEGLDLDPATNPGWTFTAAVTDPDDAALTLDSNDSVTITEDGTYTVVYTLSFAANDTDYQEQELAIDWTAVTATLTQVAPH